MGEKQPSTPQKAKKNKLMDSDEDDEEPQNVPGTSRTLGLLYQYYLFIKDQQPVRNDQLKVQYTMMKTGSTSLRSNQR